MLPDGDLTRLRQWAEQTTPEHVRDRMRVDIDTDDRHATIFESRPPWDQERMGPAWTRVPVARLRYIKSRRVWQLQYSDRDDRFHPYRGLAESSNIGDLIQEIDRDPYAIFWG